MAVLKRRQHFKTHRLLGKVGSNTASLLKSHKSVGWDAAYIDRKSNDVCASNSHRSYSSSRLSFRWAAVRCEPDRRCWCTRLLPDAASWWPRTWTESLPRCTDHTYTGSECRCIPRSDTQLPTSARTRIENVWTVTFQCLLRRMTRLTAVWDHKEKAVWCVTVKYC